MTIRLCGEVGALWSGSADIPPWRFTIDGRDFAIERGIGNDFRLTQEQGAAFHLDRDARVISCSPDTETDPVSQRLLLDTVLWTTALLHNLELIHAGAVQHGVGVFGVLAESGSGKSSLVLELIRRGHALFCDDVLSLDRGTDGLVVHPGPPLMNLPAGSGSAMPSILPIARIDGEDWVRVSNAARTPAPLVHLFLLARADGMERRVAALEATALDLLPHALMHGLVNDEPRRTFELCSELAAGVPVSRIEADLAASPEVLADLVENALRQTAL